MRNIRRIIPTENYLTTIGAIGGILSFGYLPEEEYYNIRLFYLPIILTSFAMYSFEDGYRRGYDKGIVSLYSAIIKELADQNKKVLDKENGV